MIYSSEVQRVNRESVRGGHRGVLICQNCALRCILTQIGDDDLFIYAPNIILLIDRFSLSFFSMAAFIPYLFSSGNTPCSQSHTAYSTLLIPYLHKHNEAEPVTRDRRRMIVFFFNMNVLSLQC